MLLTSCVLLFSLLPDTLLYCLSCVDLLVLHRQLLADTLLLDRPTMQTAGNSHQQHIDVHILNVTFIISDEMFLFQILCAVLYFLPSLCCWTSQTYLML